MLEAPRRSHKGLVAAVSRLIPKGPRALGGLVCVYTRSGSNNDAVGGLLDGFQKVGENMTLTLIFSRKSPICSEGEKQLIDSKVINVFLTQIKAQGLFTIET